MEKKKKTENKKKKKKKKRGSETKEETDIETSLRGWVGWFSRKKKKNSWKTKSSGGVATPAEHFVYSQSENVMWRRRSHGAR